MKTLIGIVVILFIIVIVILFSRNFLKKDFFSLNHAPTTTSKVVVNNHSLTLLVALDDKAKQIGLSGKNSLPADTGMVFPFEKASYWPFWMKNMQFPIDIVFLQNKRIVTIYENVPNPSFPNAVLPIYTPKKPADMVLEVKAGQVKILGLKEGDALNITL